MSQPGALAPAPDSSATRELILVAASARLLHYGYHKTTMAEIAEDAGMSAANLYRYFANKLELAAACATRTMNERLDRLRRIAERSETPPVERLVDYALGIIEHSHDLSSSETRVGELVDTITREHPEIVEDKMATHQALIERILADGVTRGEFVIDDLPRAARDVYSAFIVFDVPVFIGFFSREEFESRARGIVSLLVRGLSR